MKKLLTYLLTAISVSAYANVGLQNLRCEMLTNPQGIGATKPRLSWQISSDKHNTMQTAYQIIVASSAEKLAKGEGDLWDSHKVLSDKSIMVNYAGKLLTSRTNCYWKVKVWTTAGETPWSQSAKWSEGLLNITDWKAKWIGYEQGFLWDSVSKFSRLSARYFRKEFKNTKAVKEAKVYIVGLGRYELYINGKIIGDQVLAGAPTDYTASVLYNTFDVTKEVKAGNNAIGTVLGNGRFFTMRPKYKPQKIKEFGFPKMLLQMEITYQDGTKQTIISDDSWKFTADGPIRSNNEYDGEEYDATKEFNGWNTSGFNDSQWLKPQLTASPGGKIEPQVNEAIKVMGTISPQTITQIKPGVWILDMGQNFAGWIKMKVNGKKGDKVTMRFAETLTDNDLYVRNLRDAKVTDIYTLKGTGVETWRPAFVFHGFRYVEITGFPGTPTANDFEGQVVYDDLKNTGKFETSNDIINQVYKNAYWGILSDYKGMPIDCPQRNERMPWMGDRAVGSLGESFVFDNENLYAKWLNDIEQSQKPDGSIPDVCPAYWNYYSDNMTWPGTYLLINDMLYKQFADKAPIEKHYASMKKWMDYMRKKYVKNNLMTKDKYGDWCVPPESLELIHAKDSSRMTNGVLIATAYYYHFLVMMQNFAKLAGKDADIAGYTQLATTTLQAFNKKFLDTRTYKYDNNTVTANLLPLSFDMVPKGNEQKVMNNITDHVINVDKEHISTGVIGCEWLMRGLTSFGRPDLSYKIASNDDYPSWGYMVKRGATTIWELWNGDTANPEMNSRNHIMLLGDLLVYYYEDLAAIKSAAPGFKYITMKPALAGLSFVKASYDTPYGEVKSNWTNQSGRFEWHITVPVNTKAAVYLPAVKASAIKDNGQALTSTYKVLGTENGMTKVEVGSGDYDFTVNN